jgi:hypothetical protein
MRWKYYGYKANSLEDLLIFEVFAKELGIDYVHANE